HSKGCKNMNCCKFIADFLSEAFANKTYHKGCRLHLMLMYAESLDISTVKLAAIGGPHPPHKFVVSACTYDVVMVVRARDMISNTKYGKLQLIAQQAIDYSFFPFLSTCSIVYEIVVVCSHQARAPIEHLVGKFASGMTNLLGKLAEDSVALAGSDGDAVVRQFTSFVGEHIHHPTSYRGWNDYNCSQELRDT
ncbi:hypothetical protein ZWY2020_054903, partial [Hordeum vulgare]